jgi:hypothetical protein
MAGLNYLRIAQILGGTISEIPGGVPSFGSIGAVQTAAERYRTILSGQERRALELRQYPLIAKAFEKVRDGYEVDRVLVDPALSKAFISECRHLGIHAPVAEINKRLQCFRKSSRYGVKLKPTTRADGLDAEPLYYAAELGYRQFSYRSRASIDDIVTEPETGELFVKICRQIKPGGSPMLFKWAALALRKMRSFNRRQTKRLLSVDPTDIESQLRPAGTLDRIAVRDIPQSRGVFSFLEKNGSQPKYLYIGFGDNLRDSVEPFSQAQPFLALAGRFWSPSLADISINIGEFPKKWEGGSVRDWGLRLINARHPLFNIPVDIKLRSARMQVL